MNNTIMPVNTQFIRAEMRKQHLSTIQLAKRMNVDPTTIWKILSRKRGITNKTAGKMLKAFGMDKYHLYQLFIFN